MAIGEAERALARIADERFILVAESARTPKKALSPSPSLVGAFITGAGKAASETFDDSEVEPSSDFVTTTPAAPKPKPRPAAPKPANSGEGENYVWMPPMADAIAQALQERINVLLVGPTGCGKTTLFEVLLEQVFGVEPLHMSLHGEMSVDDFYGTKELVNMNTTFRPGPALRAMQEKLPLIINEMDASPPEILFCLHRPLEQGKDVIITSTNGPDGAPLRLWPWKDEKRKVRRKKTVKEKTDGKEVEIERETEVEEEHKSRFIIAATANTLGYGDDTGLYRGTQVLNQAFLDRFGLVEFLDYPPPEHESQILIRKTGIDARTAERILQVANMARSAFKDGRKLSSTFSIRKTLNWAQLVSKLGFTPQTAFISVALNRVPHEDRTALCEMYRRVFGPHTIDLNRLR